MKSLRQRGFRLTRQRLAVLKNLQVSHNYMTPAAIFEKVRDEVNDIGLVTIYRTLEMLNQAGYICRLNLADGTMSYLLRRPRHHHHHLVCSGCGLVVDFDFCNLKQIQQKVAGETGFRIDSHIFELHGMCPDCLKNTSQIRGM